MFLLPGSIKPWGGHMQAHVWDVVAKAISYNKLDSKPTLPPKLSAKPIKKGGILDRAKANLLPVPYYHYCFLLYLYCFNELLPQILHKEVIRYTNLRQALAKRCRILPQRPQLFRRKKPEMVAILHNWASANCGLHPHFCHCIVPGGGLTRNGRMEGLLWHAPIKYLFPKRAFKHCF